MAGRSFAGPSLFYKQYLANLAFSYIPCYNKASYQFWEECGFARIAGVRSHTNLSREHAAAGMIF